MDTLRGYCRELQIAACVGYPELERRTQDGAADAHANAACSCCNPSELRSVYNSSIFLSDSGEILANYRKTHLWHLLEKAFFAAGACTPEALRVFEYKGVKMGINICYDVEFAEPSRLLALEGCQLLLVPTALAKGEVHETVPLKVVPTRAVDNHVWIAYSNHVGPSYKDSNFCGLSALIGPDGEDLARAQADSTELLVAELIPGDYAKRFETTPLLLDRRAELFHNISRQVEWK